VNVRRIALYCALGIVIYVAALIATIPAPWMGLAVMRMSQQKLEVREPAGTLWSGSGRLYATRRSGPLIDLGVLRWRTFWSGMLGAKLSFEVTLGNAGKPARIELSLAGTSIRGLELALPAKILASVVPGLETFGPEGLLRLRSDELRVAGDSMLGQAELEWRQVRFMRMPELDLGSHLVRLRGGGSKVDIELATLEGPLRLSGRGAWARSTGLSVSGTAEHAAQPTPAMTAFLKGMCADYKNDRCSFQIRQ
jgi:general secretion pathway protein N